MSLTTRTEDYLSRPDGNSEGGDETSTKKDAVKENSKAAQNKSSTNSSEQDKEKSGGQFREFQTTIAEPLQIEMKQTQIQLNKIQYSNSAAVRPLTHENLAELDDLFILDNSLRETTVGSVRGHTLEE